MGDIHHQCGLYGPHRRAFAKAHGRSLAAKQLSMAELESVVIEQPDYVSALGKLITNVELQTWQDYLRLLVLWGAAPSLPKRFADQQFDFFSHTLDGVE